MMRAYERVTLPTYLPTKSLLRDKETKTLSEASTIVEAAHFVMRKEYANALDLLLMRLLAMEVAAEKKGGWERASKYELRRAIAATLASGGNPGYSSGGKRGERSNRRSG